MKYIKIFIILVLLLTGCSSSSKEENNERKITIIREDQDETQTEYQYYYEQLSDDEQQLYDDIYPVVRDVKESGKVTYKNAADTNDVYQALIYDHPELFYVDTLVVYNDLTVKPNYSFSKDEIKDYQNQLETIKDDIIESIPNGDEYDQMLYIYEYVIQNITYDSNAQYNQTLISSMINKNTVCTGYAKMIQYLYTELGINTTIIVGVSNDENERHAWNMVEYKGDYYYVDATWGDQYDGNGDIISYEFFMYNSTEMTSLYTPEVQYENTVTGDYTYFKEKDLYFENYDINELIDAVNITDRVFLVQFSDTIYSQAKDRLITSREMFDILESAGVSASNISYSYNDDLKTVKVTW